MNSLVVAADTPELAGLHWSVEALAAKAALALERIALAGEINRRAGEEYFRTLVQSTPDMILILDEGNLIRYASPSAGAGFGTPKPTGGNLAYHGEPGGRL